MPRHTMSATIPGGSDPSNIVDAMPTSINDDNDPVDFDADASAVATAISSLDIPPGRIPGAIGLLHLPLPQPSSRPRPPPP